MSMTDKPSAGELLERAQKHCGDWGAHRGSADMVAAFAVKEIAALGPPVAGAPVDGIATKTEQTYLALLLLPHNALRSRLQTELATCRDAIAFSEDTEAEEIQTRYEAYAEKLRPLLWRLSPPVAERGGGE